MVRVRTKFTLKDIPKDMSAAVKREGLLDVTDAIVEQITSGLSPVSGYNKYPDYNEDYANKKGVSKSFVTLLDTGKMLESIKAKFFGDKIEISFTDKKAEYHNDLGAGRGGVIRRMLPNRQGETFKQLILNKIVKAFNKAAESAAKKQK